MNPDLGEQKVQPVPQGLMAPDGADGAMGADGAAGAEGQKGLSIYIQYSVDGSTWTDDNSLSNVAYVRFAQNRTKPGNKSAKWSEAHLIQGPEGR